MSQPDQMVKQRRRLIHRVWKAEMVPLRLAKPLEQLRAVERVGLGLCAGIPLVGGDPLR